MSIKKMMFWFLIYKKIYFNLAQRYLIILSLFFLWSFNIKEANAQYTDLPYYDIKAQFDSGDHTIEAEQTVTFTNRFNTQIEELFFYIYPHRHYKKQEIKQLYRYAGYFKVSPFPEGFQSGDLIIKEITGEDGKPLNYSIEGDDQTLLKINLNYPISQGQTVRICMRYKVNIPHCFGRFGWHRGITTLTRWYPLLCVFDENGWHKYPFYIFHQPFFSDAAWYRLQITLPKEEMVISGCSLIEEVIHSNGTKTIVLESDAPMRDLGLSISALFKCKRLTTQDDYTIEAYYLKGAEKAASDALSFAEGLMSFYSKLFGKYPYKTFRLVPAYLGFGGDQSSGLIFLDTRIYHLPKFLRRYFDFLVSHETGHQWFYNLVGSDEYQEMVIDEGMNSYWLLRYMEKKYGRDAKVLELPRWASCFIPNFSFQDTAVMRYLFLAKNGYDRPAVGPLSSFRQPISIFALAYGKGAAVFEMLEKKIGEDNFTNLVRQYMQQFRFKNISLAKIKALAEQISGEDLGEFFKQWFEEARICDFAVKKVTPQSIELVNYGNVFMPVDVKLVYKDGAIEEIKWDGQTGRKEINLSSDKKIGYVVVDPDKHYLLDIDRTNNFWPRKKSNRFVPLYFFAYEIPVMLDRNAYNITSGPTLNTNSFGLASSIQKPYDNIFKTDLLYCPGDEAIETNLGYEVRHLLNKHTAVGIEVFNYDSNKEEDRSGGKLYARYELWPVAPSIFAVNEHFTAYLIRDQEVNRRGISSKEESKHLRYWEKDQTIFGLSGSLGRYGPFENPVYGYKVIPTLELAGHTLGGKEAFWRSSLQLQKYMFAFERWQHTLALRAKVGYSKPADKDLFELGGANGLRGYRRKEITGSRIFLSTLEYRVPFAMDRPYYFLDKLISLHTIQTIGFFDIGKGWYTDYQKAHWCRDIGVGLRLHFNLAGLLEQAVFRIDFAHPLDDSQKDNYVWFGINQAF
ncbi:MAG: M1 family aminopeptidase [Candidatus Omnitrophica bacterium]|nr:M1 family aminopeptidase [Candidatus Omnitrophota bacterium]